MKKKQLKLVEYSLPTRQQVESSWSEIQEFIDSGGTGRQDTHTVNWLFFKEPVPPKNRTFTFRGVTNYEMYTHPRYTGEFHIPVANGVSVAAVKKIVVPLLRDGFQYVGYTT